MAQALLPFAIVGSEEEIDIGGGEIIRARRYPWGIVEVDNPQHSDFVRLRSALLNSHLTDLKEITHDFLYENYRTEKLSRTVNGLNLGSQSGNGSGIMSPGMPGSANDLSSASINPEEMATQSVRIKEEQLRKEEEKLREIELKVQREISEKRQELLAREESLKGRFLVLFTPYGKLTNPFAPSHGAASSGTVNAGSLSLRPPLPLLSAVPDIPSRYDERNQCPC